MDGLGLRGIGLVALAILPLGAAPALAQGIDPYTAPYCEPLAETKLLYTNRAYLILSKPKDAPAFYYSYTILGTQQRVDRIGQLLFDDGDDHWELQSDAEGLRLLWPLRPQKQFVLQRVNRTTGVHAKVSFVVLGLEPITVGGKLYRSWKIRRLDSADNNTTFVQFLWYAPELCTLSAFTDSQHRLVRLLRILKPEDPDYGRAVVRRKGRLYFVDTGEPVD